MKRSVLLLLLCATALEAQEPKVETRPLVLSAAAAPVPALKYPLLPDIGVLKSGNAALLYERALAFEWGPQLMRRDEAFEKIDWLAGPLSAFPKADADKYKFPNALKELDLAARRMTCDWEMTERLRAEGVNLLLPDVQAFRQYGVISGIRTRRALLDRDYATASHSLQTSFALARHICEGPTLINFLVGVAITNMTTVPVEDWVQIPDSPNLYWSLTELPSPFLSMRRNLQTERLLIDNMFPGAREALRDPAKSMAQPIPSITKHFEPLNQLAEGAQKNLFGDAWIAMKVQKEARDYLMEHGRTAVQVDALGPQQTAILYLIAQFDRLFDDFAKVSSLPFWQAHPAMVQIEEDMKAEAKERPEALTLPRSLMPSINKVLVAQTRIERRIALLRSFEAIRLHAAQNKGQLLEKWADLRGIPTPLDPATGQPFDYRRDGERAILNVPGLPGRPDLAVRYEITLGKSPAR